MKSQFHTKRLNMNINKLKATLKRGINNDDIWKKFENDLAFARNWILSFERDISNISAIDDPNIEIKINEYMNNSLAYAHNMKAFISQFENTIGNLKKGAWSEIEY